MGFNTVYKNLMEMFPQIDARLLKAVAIEHSKDADAAANVVLTEILPHWSKQASPLDQSSSSSSPKGQSPGGGHSDGDEGAEHEDRSTLRQRLGMRRRKNTLGATSEPGSMTSQYTTNSELVHAHESDSTSSNKAPNASTVSHFYDVNGCSSQLFGNTETEEVILLGKTQNAGDEVGSTKVCTGMPGSLMNYECGNVDLNQLCATTESTDSVSLDKGQDINVQVGHFSEVCANDSNNSVSLEKGQDTNDSDPEQTPFLTSACLVHVHGVADGPMTDSQDLDDQATAIDASNCGMNNIAQLNEVSSIGQLVPSSVEECTSDAQERGLQSEVGSGTTDSGKPDSSGSSDLTSKQENSMSERGDIGDESTITTVTRSGQVCRIDLLEEMIEDAKNNKKTLFMAMESVMNMVKEVEIQEKAAEEAKKEAEKGDLDILIKVEEIKRMLAHAKEANDMHAGEIYGEKAILTTEARELQNRLLSLSEERDKSLAILEEMHEALKARLAAAADMRKAAEQEKLEKEESARNALAEQEAIMEKVVQESKILQEQAEENSKLQEFLMDRGRVVDSLQGEISVICQDVRLLKQKFDECVPLSESVSSSQTTCILASSGSSMKSMASIVAEQGLTSETPEKISPTPSVGIQSPKSELEDGRTGDIWKELSDEGWDFFENDPELNIKGL
ncbi:nuclear mitotic apparatus protein 1-like isoform X1 [Melia azedarach]|uniref:Nuclear mitotic apparatus protein 1-like isoform X1 n=1 Tax=Melia azedarach TaxID=155640 RepID=A0ACC1YWU6_MELAZ|nr:nuclear mitotic apparatus protein 1-like isoform X1 [Melia azedarach]